MDVRLPRARQRNRLSVQCFYEREES